MTNVKDKFDVAQRQSAFKARLDHPEPEKVHAAGITTEATLEWERQRPPPVPAPQPTPDDPAGWSTAIANADRDHQTRVAAKREAFRARAQDVKERFTLAHDYKTKRDQYER